jgi:hypothetical protein
MDSFDKGEFWKALGNLYDETLVLREAIERNFQLFEADHQSIIELRKSVGSLRDSSADQLESILHLQDAIVAQRANVDVLVELARFQQTSLQQHERRLNDNDNKVEAILEDLRRHRENRPPA